MPDLADLAAWRETLMIHARGFIFSQRCGGRKEFLRNAGLGGLAAWREMVHVDFLFSQGRGGRNEFLRNAGLGGLARDFNDSRTRIYFLAKVRRTQRNSYGMQDLAAWREFLMIHARGFIFSQRRKERKEFQRNAGLGGLGGLARDFNDSRARILCSRKGAEDAKKKKA